MEIKEYDWAGIESFSRAAFGCEHRLAVLVLAAQAEAGELYVENIRAQLAKRPGEGSLERFIRNQLLALREGALLKDAPQVDEDAWKARRRREAPDGPLGRTPKFFSRTDDDFWQSLQALGDRFRRAPRKASALGQ